jgi:putative Holliday junction resolvase
MQVMAFDFGLTRVGIAVGNTLLQIPHPVATITAKSKELRLQEIKKLVLKWQPKLFVIGEPIKSADKEELLGGLNNFIHQLDKAFNLTVIRINEDYTSDIAKGQLEEQGRGGRVYKLNLDQLAAAAILERYFSEIKEYDI